MRDKITCLVSLFLTLNLFIGCGSISNVETSKFGNNHGGSTISTSNGLVQVHSGE